MGENGDIFDLMDYGSPSGSSLDSDQTSNTDYSPTSLYSDDIDDWLQDGILQQQSSQLYTVVKEEPPSPPTINPNEINNYPLIVSPVSPTIISPFLTTTLPLKQQTNTTIPKIPICQIGTLNKMTTSTSFAPVKCTMVNSATSKVSNGLLTSSANNSNILQIKNIIPVPIKTEQLNTALLPREKYSIPPKIVKLENGQFYIARSVLKGPASKQSATAQAGQKRQATVPTTASITKDYSDLKNMKRQQRMMKNRESACLSRQRKKDHLSTLEIRVSEISVVNEHLKEENKKLRNRITILESENSQLKVKMPPGTFKENAKKSTTLVMAILLFVIFNPFKLSSKTLPETAILKPSQTIHSYHRGRSLLQYDNSNINYDPSINDVFKFRPMKNIVQDMFDSLPQKENIVKLRRKPSKKIETSNRDKDLLLETSDFSQTDIDCEEPFNKTDLSRINKVLEGLVKGFDKENIKKKKAKQNMKFKKFHLLKHFQHDCNETDDKEHKPVKQQIVKPLITPIIRSKYRKSPQKIPIPRNNSQELFNEIKRSMQRKPDTFYVISMKDFLLLPATNYSQEHRPKFSFMLPAFVQTGNETSLKDGEVSMLQIDCNVLDTKLIRLNKNAISKQLLTQLQYS